MRGHHSKALNAAQRTAGAGASQPEVDAFVDHLWLEAGLAKNSLDAYRRDVSIYAAWLDGRALHSSTEADVQRLLAVVDQLGLPRMTVVGHSMGGLCIREYLQRNLGQRCKG